MGESDLDQLIAPAYSKYTNPATTILAGARKNRAAGTAAVVTEGIFSYCGVKIKIDTDRHLGAEAATVRSQGEAATARAADHAVETNRKQDIPVTLDTSPEIHRLADEQARVKAEQQQADQQKQHPPKDRPRGQRI